MKIKVTLILLCALLSACAPARFVGNAAVTTGQVALGAADLVL